MRTKKVVVDNRPKIKVQLDQKTQIVVRSMSAFNMWKEKYPEAKLIE